MTKQRELERLEQENRGIIESLLQNGAECSGEKHFEFIVSLNTREEIYEFKERYRASGKRPAKSTMMTKNDPGDYQFDLLLYDFLIEVDAISLIECHLPEFAKHFGNAEVSWEFKE